MTGTIIFALISGVIISIALELLPLQSHSRTSDKDGPRRWRTSPTKWRERGRSRNEDHDDPSCDHSNQF
jgi:hypothetical protein